MQSTTRGSATMAPTSSPSLAFVLLPAAAPPEVSADEPWAAAAAGALSAVLGVSASPALAVLALPVCLWPSCPCPTAPQPYSHDSVSSPSERGQTSNGDTPRSLETARVRTYRQWRQSGMHRKRCLTHVHPGLPPSSAQVGSRNLRGRVAHTRSSPRCTLRGPLHSNPQQATAGAILTQARVRMLGHIPFTAAMCMSPQDVAMIRTPASAVHLVGTVRSASSPWPNTPYRPLPHVYTTPAAGEGTERRA